MAFVAKGRYLLIYFIVALLVHSSVVYGTEPLPEFCNEQENQFESCSDAMRDIYINHGNDVDVMCSGMSAYLKCVFEINITCPDIHPFSDDVFISSVNHSRHVFHDHCPNYELVTTCTPSVVSDLVEACMTILNKGQLDSTREQMCQISTDYVICLERSTTACQNSMEFLAHNVPAAVTRTQSLMRGYCDDIQGDAPSSFTAPDQPVHDAVCSEHRQTAETQCFAHLQQPPEVTSINGCRHQRMFLDCMEHLILNCPDVARVYGQSLREAEDALSTFCTGMGCPAEVEDGPEDAVSYCLQDLYDVEPTDEDYCRKLSDVPPCILSLRDLCPPDLHSYHVDGGLLMIEDLLRENCGSEWLAQEH